VKNGVRPLFLLLAVVLGNGALAAEPQEEARALAARAAGHQALGFRQRAVQDLEAALALVEKSPGAEALLASVRGALGQAYLRAGNRDKAGEQLEAALKLARERGFMATAAAALNDLGRLHAAAGRPEQALAAWRDSANLARQANAPLTFASAAVNTSAPELLDEADRLLAVLPDSRESEFARIRLAVAIRPSRPQRAAELLRAAFESSSRRGDALVLSWAAGHLGELYALAARDAEALALTRQAVFAAQAARAEESLYRWSWQAGRLLAKAGDRAGAESAYRRALVNLQAVRQDLILELRASGQSWRDTVGPLFLELAELLLRRAPGETVPQPRLVEARNLVEQLKAVELEDYFQDECVAGQLARTKDVDAIEPRTAVLYPIILPERTEMLIGLAGGIRQVTLPTGQAALTELALEFRRRLEKRTTNEFLPFARRLYAALIQPLEPLLAEASVDTIVFVPDGPVRGVPVAALNDGKGFLVERFAFATAPGLTLVEPQALRAKRDISVMLSGLSDSVQNFPALPYVENEINDLQALFAGKRVLRNREFSVQGFTQEMRARPYSIVHIASHGMFDSDPKKSFLLAHDGKLTMDGLEQVMRLVRFRDDPVELLTLSACRTAAGDERATLGLAGVAVKAGARSALATLWYVNDQASSVLVTDFYKQLRDSDISKAKALQNAQRGLITDGRFRHPIYWAPFLLIGNWL
jgi:CHAT domain-containing protein